MLVRKMNIPNLSENSALPAERANFSQMPVNERSALKYKLHITRDPRVMRFMSNPQPICGKMLH